MTNEMKKNLTTGLLLGLITWPQYLLAFRTDGRMDREV
jgi:hypothetical protein